MREFVAFVSSGFGGKFFLGNWRHHNWQPIHQIFTLRVTIDFIGQFGEIGKQEFSTKVYFELIEFVQLNKQLCLHISGDLFILLLFSSIILN